MTKIDTFFDGYEPTRVNPRKMPKQKPGRSKQNYGTPENFICAVLPKLGITSFARDLAADKDNTQGKVFFTEKQNSLTKCWFDIVVPKWQWMNPPFSDIRPWAEKAYRSSLCGAQIAMLIPASVGANWWRDWVHEKARVFLLNGRIHFVGCEDPYPKDCALLLYSRNWDAGYDVWTWTKGAL